MNWTRSQIMFARSEIRTLNNLLKWDSAQSTIALQPGHLSLFIRPMEMKVKVIPSCPTLCYPVDYTVHGILQARILEWVAIPFSRGSSQTKDQTQISHIAGGFFTSWAMRESQEYWSGFLLQRIFPTQESNQGLLQCRQILYNWVTREAPHDLLSQSN